MTKSGLRTTRSLTRLLTILCVLVIWLAGCWRDSPPEIQEFRPPAAPVEEAPATQPVTQASAPVIEAPKPEPEPEAKPQAVNVAVTAASAPPPEPLKEAPKAPTIIGTWKLVSVSHGGQQQNIPPGVEITITFSQDGTIATSTSMQGQSRNETGSYTVEGNQITMTTRGRTQTGTVTFNGNEGLVLEMREGGGQATVTLTRV